MKNKIIVALISICFLGFYSCKTNEKNYRTAYETAKAAITPTDDIKVDSLIQEEEKGLKTVVGGESVRTKTEFVTIIDDSNLQIFPYSVVVGSFRQIFNAQSFKARLIEKKYPAHIAKNREDQYYVVIKGFDTASEAALFIKNKKNIPFPLPIEPFILNSAR